MIIQDKSADIVNCFGVMGSRTRGGARKYWCDVRGHARDGVDICSAGMGAWAYAGDKWEKICT
jgi:hypothetical protein